MSTTEKLRECMYNRREIGGTETFRCLTAVQHTGSDTGLQVQQHGGELEYTVPRSVTRGGDIYDGRLLRCSCMGHLTSAVPLVTVSDQSKQPKFAVHIHCSELLTP